VFKAGASFFLQKPFFSPIFSFFEKRKKKRGRKKKVCASWIREHGIMKEDFGGLVFVGSLPDVLY